MRGEEGSGWLRGLVNALESTRWRVVVSIRQFDLHHSPAWQRMLRGAPVSTVPSRRDVRLAGVRHLLVGDLTDGELAALAPQSAQLARLLHEASPRLRELLRNPFNLSLAGDLLIAGQSQTSLAQIRSQLELLQRYWQHRVTLGDTGRQRVRVLTSLTTAMIERRRLQVDATGLFDAAESRIVEALLHDGVLREAPHRLLASSDRHVLFAHHVLFDFAVAALLLAVAADHPLARRKSVSVEDLADHSVCEPAGLPVALADELIPRTTPSGRPIHRKIPVSTIIEILELVGRGKIVHPTVKSLAAGYPRQGVAFVPIRDLPRSPSVSSG